MKSEFRPASLLPALVLIGALFGCATDPPRGAAPPPAAPPAAEGEAPSVSLVMREIDPATPEAVALDPATTIVDAPEAPAAPEAAKPDGAASGGAAVDDILDAPAAAKEEPSAETAERAGEKPAEAAVATERAGEKAAATVESPVLAKEQAKRVMVLSGNGPGAVIGPGSPEEIRTLTKSLAKEKITVVAPQGGRHGAPPRRPKPKAQGEGHAKRIE